MIVTTCHRRSPTGRRHRHDAEQSTAVGSGTADTFDNRGANLLRVGHHREPLESRHPVTGGATTSPTILVAGAQDVRHGRSSGGKQLKTLFGRTPMPPFLRIRPMQSSESALLVPRAVTEPFGGVGVDAIPNPCSGVHRAHQGLDVSAF